MIAPAIATISASRSPSALPNCGARTSPAARNVNSAIPVPRGSTTTIRSRRLRVRRPSPTTPTLAIAAPITRKRLDRDRAIGIDEVRAVEIDRIDVATRYKLLQVDDLCAFDIERLHLVG